MHNFIYSIFIMIIMHERKQNEVLLSKIQIYSPQLQSFLLVT